MKTRKEGSDILKKFKMSHIKNSLSQKNLFGLLGLRGCEHFLWLIFRLSHFDAVPYAILGIMVETVGKREHVPLCSIQRFLEKRLLLSFNSSHHIRSDVALFV